MAQDFIVDEISDIPISKQKKQYSVYTLAKKGIETFSLIEYLSRKNKIPAEEFRIAGLKDRHAFTTQYITIPSSRKLTLLQEENFSLKHIGYSEKPLRLGDLEGNRFVIVVRNLLRGEIDGVIKKAADIESAGVPNYFDSQRFGSVINRNFIAKCLVQKRYEDAVKTHLTMYSPFESACTKKDKRYILQNWEKLPTLTVGSAGLQCIIDEYASTKSWIRAYRKMPSNLREIIISAYQSYLWNECIKRLLRKTLDTKRLYTIEYSVGSLLFYRNMKPAELQKLPMTFKTISDQMTMSDTEKKIISDVLDSEEVAKADFNIKDATGSFFKTHERSVIMRPQNFRISRPETDELNDKGRKNIFKMTVSFTLQKGSYATMITKRLFNK